MSPSAVPRFMQRLEEVSRKLGSTGTILAAATGHHCVASIHSFTDGNGRVVRLMPYAMLREILETGGVWSLARGLARNVDEYKQHLAAYDLPRRNDLDGRGHLSAQALVAFTAFFLRACIDQVKSMEDLIQPDRLRNRFLIWIEEIRMNMLPPKSGNVLEAALYRGELPRAGVPALLGTGPRQARRIVSALIERGVLTSRIHSRRAAPELPHRTGLTLDAGLFPEKRMD